jgi:precorrin-6B methylase 2
MNSVILSLVVFVLVITVTAVFITGTDQASQIIQKLLPLLVGIGVVVNAIRVFLGKSGA